MIGYCPLFQQDDKFHMSFIDLEDALVESGNSFLIRRPLCRPKTTQVLTIESSSIAQQFLICVEKGADDGSEVHYLQSVHHYRSNLVTKFTMFGRQIITGKARWGPSLLSYGEFAISPFTGNGWSRCLSPLISI